MFQQYHDIKCKHLNEILLFRLGDFYEMFGDDAKKGSQALSLVLTSREIGKGNRIPMCGIPYHALDRYLRRLLRQGFKVAVCDQVEDASATKGIVRREVVRVLTPGTVVEDSMLESRSNNFLAAIETEDGNSFGLAICDVSTGELLVTELNDPSPHNQLREELERLGPAEILLPGRITQDPNMHSLIKDATTGNITEFDRDYFSPKTPHEQICEHFKVASLRGFGCEDMLIAVRATALVLSYLNETHRGAAEHISGISTYQTSHFMMLDTTTRRNLELLRSITTGELDGSLISVLDKTVTPMGSRLLKRWLLQPLLDVEEINERLDAVEQFHSDVALRQEVADYLRACHDLERSVARTGTHTSDARDLAGIRATLDIVPRLQELLANTQVPRLQSIRSQLSAPEDLREHLIRALVEEPPARISDGGVIKQGYHTELDELRVTSENAKDSIASLESRERQRTTIKSLKVGYNQVFGYFIEVTRPNLNLVPAEFKRKQTMANAERFITTELKDLESKVLGAQERISELEYELFCRIRHIVAQHSRQLLLTARALTELDVFHSLAEVAAKRSYIRPTITDSNQITIHGGRHPVIEQKDTTTSFVSNDTKLDTADNQLLVITGPNMSGKSTWLRQTALIVLLAQMGSYVPANSAHVGVVNRIFTRVGAHDDIATGQSTFMVEMSETANILNNATNKSLVIIDEIGRGTSTYDGVSIAWAVAEQLHQIGVKCLFATHFHHLNELEGQLPGVRNYQASVKERANELVFLYQIATGGTDKSYGIQVSRLAGMPPQVVDRARQVLNTLEVNHVHGPSDNNQNTSHSEPPLATPINRCTSEDNAILENLTQLDVNAMTPIEALTKLVELKEQLGRTNDTDIPD